MTNSYPQLPRCTSPAQPVQARVAWEYASEGSLRVELLQDRARMSLDLGDARMLLQDLTRAVGELRDRESLQRTANELREHAMNGTPEALELARAYHAASLSLDLNVTRQLEEPQPEPEETTEYRDSSGELWTTWVHRLDRSPCDEPGPRYADGSERMYCLGHDRRIARREA